MKYLPLVWAAIMRKPARAILTLLSVTVAFILFGLTIGMNATFDAVEKSARDDRIYVVTRFFGVPMPWALEQQIAGMPGIAKVGAANFMLGYYQDPKNHVLIQVLDSNVRKVMGDWPLTVRQWDQLDQNRTGLVVSRIQAQRWHLKPGDNFTVVLPQFSKADGSKNWTFQVLSVADDIAYMTNGYLFGNYDYFDKSRPPDGQGKINQLYVLTSDPAHTADIAKRIDDAFANSATPLQSMTEKTALDVSNSGLDIAAIDRDIALAGMFMVLFLTANGIAQAVRERFVEFATLKTIGFSDRDVILLVFAEAAFPCLLGAGLGVGLAALIADNIPRLMPASIGTPPLPTLTAMVFVWAAASALLVALASSALPALRLRQMDIATALSGRT